MGKGGKEARKEGRWEGRKMGRKEGKRNPHHHLVPSPAEDNQCHHWSPPTLPSSTRPKVSHGFPVATVTTSFPPSSLPSFSPPLSDYPATNKQWWGSPHRGEDSGRTDSSPLSWSCLDDSHHTGTMRQSGCSQDLWSEPNPTASPRHSCEMPMTFEGTVGVPSTVTSLEYTPGWTFLGRYQWYQMPGYPWGLLHKPFQWGSLLLCPGSEQSSVDETG